MFISRDELMRLRRAASSAESNYDRLNERYWDLRHEFNLLTEHLGVSIETVERHRVVKKTG